MIFKILKKNDELGLDNEKLSFSYIQTKLSEEYDEVVHELASENWYRLGLEVMDLIQVCILILWRLNRRGVSIRSLEREHNEKLEKRGWITESIINVKFEDTNNMP